MPVIPTGDVVGTLFGTHRLAHEADRRRVVVSGASEAIDDHGWPTILRAAERKYAAREWEQTGETRLVRVTSGECEPD